MYHGGKSEVILGEALKPVRDKVYISTKLPVILVNSPDDFDRILNDQLMKLQTDHADVYLLHGLFEEVWKKVRDMGILDFLARAKGDGRIRHVGFSFHDSEKVFREIVDSYEWELCQIQYNYYDEFSQPGRAGLSYAASKGLGVVVMEPIRGGKLAEPVPQEVQAIWDSSPIKRSAAEWALRWVWNHKEVSTVLSGMSTMAQVVENCRIADDAVASSLTEGEITLIEKARAAYREMVKIDCTGCGYCMPCTVGVSIPTMFSSYNDLFVFPHKAELISGLYNVFLKPEQRASACIECGECEEKCPQHISIREELKKVHEALYRAPSA
jgi:predicted aldo/keto reductase-like oxidoreductase